MSLLTDYIKPFDFNQLKQNKRHAISAFQHRLKNAKKTLKTAFYTDFNAAELIKEYASFIDFLLTSAWALHEMPPDQLCLIAIGGYGRSELHPHSDIDFLLLTNNQTTDTINPTIESFIVFLWDIGLEIGHSVHTLHSCVDSAKTDLMLITNLIESRYLQGNINLFKTLMEQTNTNNMWPTDRFYQAKVNERETRYQKYDNTAYNLEPNIKNSPGGLRDLHFIAWVAKRHFGVSCLRDVIPYGFMSTHEYRELITELNFLWQIRYALHLIAGRHEDRLLFDYQIQLAKLFGYCDDNQNQAVEQFMQRYFHTLKALNELYDLLNQALDELVLIRQHEKLTTRILDGSFEKRGHCIAIRKDRAFYDDPANLLRLFYMMGKEPDQVTISANTLRAIRQARHLINDNYRQNPLHRQLFLQIISESHQLPDLLQKMNRYRLLGLYLPYFQAIISQMQYDLFHAYTVDQHTLFVIKQLFFFKQDSAKIQFPLAHELIQQIDKPELLSIAALFHDTGKDSSHDHALIGAKWVMAFCHEHGISEHDTELIRWLVHYHLLMSTTAQREDIHSPAVINQFAKHVQTVNRLNYLYLLTVADISATNPNLWNNWRSHLLSELYQLTKIALPRYLDDPILQTDMISTLKKQALEFLQSKEYTKEAILALWANHYDDYFLHCTSTELVWHTRLLLDQHQAITYPMIAIYQPRALENTQLFVHTPNYLGLFAECANIISQEHFNILAAHIHSTKDNFSLNTFIISDKQFHNITDKYVLHHLVKQLKKRLQSKIKINFSLRSPHRKRRELTHFSIPLSVRFYDGQSPYTIIAISTHDRSGLLATIGAAFLECHIMVHSAKIVTEGERVNDIFRVTSTKADHDISTPEQQDLLYHVLKRLLG